MSSPFVVPFRAAAQPRRGGATRAGAEGGTPGAIRAGAEGGTPGAIRAGALATRAEVGGKAAALIRMSEAGLPVPPGVVLTSAFFAPWISEVRASPAWARLVEASPSEWSALCGELKERARAVPLTAGQRDALSALLGEIGELEAPGDVASFAVRSSSPEEDLASASFAGLYETRLGVRAHRLEDAVRYCFASLFDVRVLTYKRGRDQEPWSPLFALIVQRQIDSDVSGVAFSLNPVTNDYDEAVIEASWGLGTAVVDGLVSPDRFVVSMVDGRVVEETRGDKLVSIRLDPDGGTVERQTSRPAERALSDAQLRELSEVLRRIEALYDTPVDVEWAYAGTVHQVLHILQARPITRYVPLPPEMVTRPGEPRRLYADAALSKGLTMNGPISPMGLDVMERMFAAILESWVGPVERDVAPANALHIFAGSRMYMNLSSMLWLASPKTIAKSTAPTDTLMAGILAGVDPKRYRPASRPSWVSARLFWQVPRVLWNLRGFLWNALRAIASPEVAHRAYRQRIAALEAELREIGDRDFPLAELQRAAAARLVREFDILMAALVVGQVSPDLVLCRKPASALSAQLGRGVTGDVVVEMGIAMQRVAKLLPHAEFEDVPRLAERVGQRRLPPEFLSAWDAFLSRFGSRGPREMDVASPRYADDPTLALRQMSFMAVDGGFDSEAVHLRHVEERRGAYAELIRESGPLRRALLRRIERLSGLFAGARDTPKHLIVLSNHAIRRHALETGRRLVREGRLDDAEHVFDLTIDDLRAAAKDSALDVRGVRKERTAFRDRLVAHVTHFPPVIDSRGRILRPPSPGDAPGLLRGMPVSPGVAIGPVRVLHRADERVLESGDVLVAYTTDPGWTPLFVNAAAIVLEVGGVLQHGALLARELGKPCVVGIDRVVTRLRDGNRVEVDGAAGTVRVLA